MKYVTETSKPVAQALEDLERAVQDHGFGILHTYDLKATLKEKGHDLPHACHILEVCNPNQAVKVLSEDMDMNIALPCRISVYEENGATKIGMARPTDLLAQLSDSPKLGAIAREVEDTMMDMIRDTV